MACRWMSGGGSGQGERWVTVCLQVVNQSINRKLMLQAGVFPLHSTNDTGSHTILTP